MQSQTPLPTLKKARLPVKLNVLLLAIAAILIGIVTYRMNIVQLNRKFVFDLLPNLVVGVVLLGLLYKSGGTTAVTQGAWAGMKVTLNFIPLLLMVFWAVGEGSVLIGMHREAVHEAISGKYGVVGAFVAAVVMPSSMTGLPIVADLWNSGADKTVLVTFLMVSSLVGIQLVMFRQPMLGWHITGWYLAAALSTSFLFALGASIWRLRA